MPAVLEPHRRTVIPLRIRERARSRRRLLRTRQPEQGKRSAFFGKAGSTEVCGENRRLTPESHEGRLVLKKIYSSMMLGAGMCALMTASSGASAADAVPAAKSIRVATPEVGAQPAPEVKQNRLAPNSI